MTRLEDALRGKGFRGTEDRIKAAARKAVRERRGFEAQVSGFYEQLIDDAAALWVLLQAYKAEAARSYLRAADAERREEEHRKAMDAARTERRSTGGVQSIISPPTKPVAGSKNAAGEAQKPAVSQPPSGFFRPQPKVKPRELTLEEKRREEQERARERIEFLLQNTKLYKLHINARPLAYCTVTEALSWAESQRRQVNHRMHEVRFVEMVAHPAPEHPPGKPLKDYYRDPEEINALWERAAKPPEKEAA